MKHRIQNAFTLVSIAVLAGCSITSKKTDDYESRIRSAYTNNDIERANRLLAEWAATGDSRALFNLGSNYERGIGCSKTPTTAFGLMKRSAEGGYPSAYVNLSAYYLTGFGTDVDLGRALEWRTKSAAAGNMESLHLLVLSFYTGGDMHQRSMRLRPKNGSKLALPEATTSLTTAWAWVIT